MALALGTRLGAYEIVSLLGKGGMGEVYRARDTRLDRTVAIKILPDALAGDPQFRERFDREARAISQLDHPHICTLYDVGEHDGSAYLVLQYLEGQTLADLLAKGPLPLGAALEYAVQIAGALDKAHRSGIVHRDLKPGNVMITKAGAKLLDFGLAKSTGAAVATSSLSLLPTMPPTLTGQGTILGTFQYMAPEQLEGQEADARTDVFAFGAVVYETLTGKKAFEGKSQASLIAAILEREPVPLSSLQPLAPAALDRVIRKCLAKEADERWQTAKDLQDELRWIVESPAYLATSSSTPVQPRWKKLLAAAVGVILVATVAAAITWSVTRRGTPTPRGLTRFAITLAPTDQFTGLDRPVVAISSDGTRIVYIANNRLYLRTLDELEAAPIRGTDSGAAASSPVNPFFSPDGQWIGFWQSGQLKKVSIAGGAPIVLCAIRRPSGASWGADGTIVFSQGPEGIWRVSEAGGTPEVIVQVEPGKGALNPQIIPGSRAVLFTLRNITDATSDQIVVHSLDSNTRRVLVQHGSAAQYLSTGHLAYANAGTVSVAPFDLATLTVRGRTVPLTEGVLERRTSAAVHLGVSQTGTLVFVPAQATERRILVWVDRQGREEPVSAEPQAYGNPRISPDGTRVAVLVRQPGQDQAVWIWDFAKARLTRLTLTPSSNFPIWSLDGRYIVFNSNDGILRQAADGAGTVERLIAPTLQTFPEALTPDGKALVVSQRNLKAQWDLAVVSMAGDHTLTQLLGRPSSNERFADLSPDGRWIAYQSDESGSEEIYVRPFPRVDDGRSQISTGGGSTPVWARSGRELFYLAPGGRMMSVAVEGQPSFSVGKPTKLFDRLYDSPSPARHFDVAPDGKRFLMIKQSGGSSESARIIVVENWFEELKARVPAK